MSQIRIVDNDGKLVVLIPDDEDAIPVVPEEEDSNESKEIKNPTRKTIRKKKPKDADA